LDFRNSDNIELYPNDFSQYSDKSVYLHLSDDDVEELSAETAVSNSTKNIFYLSDLSNKYLSIIEKNIFDNLKNLTKLDLSYNNLSIIDYRIFSQLSDLEELYMSHNIIIFIDYRLFNNLEKLNKLDLSYNKIRFLDYRFLITILYAATDYIELCYFCSIKRIIMNTMNMLTKVITAVTETYQPQTI
ncbi:unnamed protein product, partial [Timema podura]|nr:unnamed protein product [Timema podura]